MPFPSLRAPYVNLRWIPNFFNLRGKRTLVREIEGKNVVFDKGINDNCYTAQPDHNGSNIESKHLCLPFLFFLYM